MAPAPAWCTWFAILLAAAAAQGNSTNTSNSTSTSTSTSTSASTITSTVRVVGDLNDVVFKLEEIRLANGSKTTDHGGTGNADEIQVRLRCEDDASSESDQSKKHEITSEQSFVSLGGDGPSVTCRNPSTYPHLKIEMIESDILQNDKGETFLSGASFLLLPVGATFKTRVWISVKHLLKDLTDAIGTQWFDVCLMDVVSAAATMGAGMAARRIATMAGKKVSAAAKKKALSAAGFATDEALSGTTLGDLASKLGVLNPCVNPVDVVMDGANWDGALYELTLSVHDGETFSTKSPGAAGAAPRQGLPAAVLAAVAAAWCHASV